MPTDQEARAALTSSSSRAAEGLARLFAVVLGLFAATLALRLVSIVLELGVSRAYRGGAFGSAGRSLIEIVGLIILIQLVAQPLMRKLRGGLPTRGTLVRAEVLAEPESALVRLGHAFGMGLLLLEPLDRLLSKRVPTRLVQYRAGEPAVLSSGALFGDEELHREADGSTWALVDPKQPHRRWLFRRVASAANRLP